MSGSKESVKRERAPKLVKVTKEKKVQFLSSIVLKKKHFILNRSSIISGLFSADTFFSSRGVCLLAGY